MSSPLSHQKTFLLFYENLIFAVFVVLLRFRPRSTVTRFHGSDFTSNAPRQSFLCCFVQIRPLRVFLLATSPHFATCICSLCWRPGPATQILSLEFVIASLLMFVRGWFATVCQPRTNRLKKVSHHFARSVCHILAVFSAGSARTSKIPTDPTI
ncbi:hypothetical protein L596_019018 [Steinernema carpocapsae]|uniref:Uncharacterized protein n=1 Tax=Steinernema carpocapsae TaxID=34508 RepID=A0A4U5N6U9_STECR|nr:hypothetical protein L596_019018 [Steinernema carpocapsae]